LGHEIGYHYEDVDIAYWDLKSFLTGSHSKNEKVKIERYELIDLTFESYLNNLEKIRGVADIKIICMHGSPRSNFDNKIIWGKYNHKDVGIIGEPYLDINWNEFAF